MFVKKRRWLFKSKGASNWYNLQTTFLKMFGRKIKGCYYGCLSKQEDVNGIRYSFKYKGTSQMNSLLDLLWVQRGWRLEESFRLLTGTRVGFPGTSQHKKTRDYRAYYTGNKPNYLHSGVTTNVMWRHINDTVQFKPIRVRFIVIIIQSNKNKTISQLRKPTDWTEASLALNLPSWACTRRLWREKTPF